MMSGRSNNSVSSIRNVARATSTSGRGGSSVPREQLRVLFNIFDVDRAGVIDAPELKAGLRALGIPISAIEVREILQSEGKSVSDAITFDEFCLIAESRLPTRDSPDALRQLFSLFGGDEYGSITFAQLRRVCDELKEDIPDQDLILMIQEADQDNDGKVTFDDFCRIMRLKFDPLSDDDNENISHTRNRIHHYNH